MAPLVKSNSIGSDQIAVFIPQHIFFGSVDFEPYLISTIIEEDYLVDFILFLKKHNILELMAWFKLAKHFNHKIPIQLIIPSKKCWLIYRIVVWETKNLLIMSQKFFEHELLVNILLYFFW